LFTARYGLSPYMSSFVLPTQCIFVCFVWVWEKTAIISLYSINWLVFITETEFVCCAVQTESLYVFLCSAHTAVFMCFVWVWEQTAIISLYNINWLVFITETGCVYCAVRTGSLYTLLLPERQVRSVGTFQNDIHLFRNREELNYRQMFIV